MIAAMPMPRITNSRVTRHPRLVLLAVAALLSNMAVTFPVTLLGHFAHLRQWLAEQYRLQPIPSITTSVALHHTLTGLPNGALLTDRLTQAVARANRNGARVGLLIIDLDQFKSINEKLGNAAGDAALIEVARRLGATVRESDTLAHVGADQFAVVMGELDGDYETAKVAVCAVAAKCLDAVLPLITLNGAPYQLGASAGIALSHFGMNLDDLQTAAHHALHEAKQAGGDRYFIAAPAAAVPAIPARPAMASA